VCGILGVAGPRHGELAEDAGLYRSLAHRGPDGEGVVVRDGVALAHTRLSIIDLANGAQPMETSDGKLAITFNGEIYNYRELRHSLEQAGHCFNTDSDTEVLLNAYQEWGKHCLQRLRGMFSFGIVDYEKRNLFLARDPLGIKPLVYSYAGGHFSFASEIQGLCVLPGSSSLCRPSGRFMSCYALPIPLHLVLHTMKFIGFLLGIGWSLVSANNQNVELQCAIGLWSTIPMNH
jgi:asparagine synthase (glutamine-hydrolysing)